MPNYYYELLGVPENVPWLSVVRSRNRVQPVRAAGTFLPLPAADDFRAAPPLRGIGGYDWYRFQIKGFRGSVGEGWIPPEHESSVFWLGYHDYTGAEGRAARIAASFRALSEPLADEARLVSELRERGLLLNRLDDRGGRIGWGPLPGRKPLRQLVLT